MADAPLPAGAPARARRPALGYLMVAAAAVLFAVNGAVAKVVLASGITSLRLSEVRSAGAAVGLGLVVLLIRPGTLRVRRSELPRLVVFGVAAVGLVQLFYFLAIHRLQIGIALLIQYLAPLLVALWARFVLREPVRRRIWVALVLSLGGLTLVVDLWRGLTLDGLGVAFALASALTYTAYLLMAERAVAGRDPLSLLAWGFLFASALWACIQPWWSFPVGRVARDVSLLGNLSEVELPVWVLMASVVVSGTMIPFALVVGALRHLPATRVAIVAMLEPVVGTIVAYAWLGERLGAAQAAGGAVVLAAIFLAQTAR